LLIGQAVGRWGNFVNGEAYGYQTKLPWAMTINNTAGGGVAKSVHPTFLYESLWNTAGIFILLKLKRYKKFDGEVFWLYVVWYGIGRFLIEGLRTDSLMFFSIRISQIVALISAFAGIAAIIIFSKKNAKVVS
jgi:phosphatidylglycerol---prolipoprotein diacylglyceryl transferase